MLKKKSEKQLLKLLKKRKSSCHIAYIHYTKEQVNLIAPKGKMWTRQESIGQNIVRRCAGFMPYGTLDTHDQSSNGLYFISCNVPKDVVEKVEKEAESLSSSRSNRTSARNRRMAASRLASKSTKASCRLTLNVLRAKNKKLWKQKTVLLSS